MILALVTMMVQAATATGTATPPAPVDAKLVCRRETVTGSLAGGRRVCMTKAQWERQATRTQADIQQHIETHMTAYPTGG